MKILLDRLTSPLDFTANSLGGQRSMRREHIRQVRVAVMRLVAGCSLLEVQVQFSNH